MGSSICLVVWEDWSDCLITGREMSGVPKIWADIDFDNGNTSKLVRAGWGGLEFLNVSIELGPVQHYPDQPKQMGQYKVLNALAALPVRSTPSCGLTNSEVWLRND